MRLLISLVVFLGLIMPAWAGSQLFIGGTDDGPATGATEYENLTGGNFWDATLLDAESMASAAGTVTSRRR